MAVKGSSEAGGAKREGGSPGWGESVASGAITAGKGARGANLAGKVAEWESPPGCRMLWSHIGGEQGRKEGPPHKKKAEAPQGLVGPSPTVP